MSGFLFRLGTRLAAQRMREVESVQARVGFGPAEAERVEFVEQGAERLVDGREIGVDFRKLFLAVLLAQFWGLPRCQGKG